MSLSEAMSRVLELTLLLLYVREFELETGDFGQICLQNQGNLVFWGKRISRKVPTPCHERLKTPWLCEKNDRNYQNVLLGIGSNTSAKERRRKRKKDRFAVGLRVTFQGNLILFIWIKSLSLYFLYFFRKKEFVFKMVQRSNSLDVSEMHYIC